jgi:hypothetical protein
MAIQYAEIFLSEYIKEIPKGVNSNQKPKKISVSLVQLQLFLPHVL